MPSGTLELVLLGATDLKNTDIFGKSDPYAIVKCSTQSFRSDTAKGQGSNPLWNQKFVFNVEDGVEDLFIKIYDKDHVFGSDDFVGTAKIPLEAAAMPDQASYDVILPSGITKGQVKVAMKFSPNKS